MAVGRWHVAQLSGGCEKGWHYVSLPDGSGGKIRDIAGAAGGAGAGLDSMY